MMSYRKNKKELHLQSRVAILYEQMRGDKPRNPCRMHGKRIDKDSLIDFSGLAIPKRYVLSSYPLYLHPDISLSMNGSGWKPEFH